MKVVIITRYFLPVKGGIENHCYNLAKELLKRDIDVEIHTSKDTLTERGILEDYEIIDGIKVFRYKDFWRYVPKDNDVDVIHLHNFNVFPHFWIFLKIFIRRLFKMRTPKLVITLHGGFTPWWKGFSSFGGFIKQIYHKTLGKFFLNHVVDKIIAVSEWEREQLIREDVNARKIVVITNAVEKLAYSLPKKESVDLEVYTPYLLFIGRISRIKNLEFVIRNLGKIKDRVRINFLIAGSIQDKEYYKYLNNLILEFKLQDRVIFLGEVYGESKYELIDNALAVVLVSHFETEPLIVKEAMARGKPVIVSNITPLEYLVENEENGFVVANEKGFMNAVISLLNNEDLVNKMSENNKAKAQEWRWEKVCDKILKVYWGRDDEDNNSRI